MSERAQAASAGGGEVKAKLHGRAFYESIGSPKFIVAPMVDQSEFAWRMLTRSYLPSSEQSNLLAYTPMFHARLFAQEDKYRRAHFQATRPDTTEPWLDGNPSIDRPLFVQFCANDPAHLLAAAKLAAPHCDAVDLNLGCPQGIARKGHYGAFLQEDQDLIFRLINTLHKELPIPVTAKIRILETREKTLEYARNVLRAGASILTVHGRRREQKGHLTGVADWDVIRYLRENLPPETVLFANGNILQAGDVQRCLEATGADGVMSAEGNLSDPAIFGRAPGVGEEGREYWRGKDGKGGWRVDAVMRRYMDILHRYAEGVDPPQRRPLFIPGDEEAAAGAEAADTTTDEPPAKKRRKDTPTSNKRPEPNPNFSAVQSHLFHLLRHLVSRHTDVRDMLARSSRGGMPAFECVLAAVESKVAAGLAEYERTGGSSWDDEVRELYAREDGPEGESSVGTMKRCKRPWWVVQPIVRPLPSEAMAKGAIRPSKKDRQEQKKEQEEASGKGIGGKSEDSAAVPEGDGKKKNGNVPVEEENGDLQSTEQQKDLAARDELVAG
ncbi:tRNA-dihydrouridine(16/17) synthase [NAD(P)(+)]-like protein [Hapsidospora chrysogenum ATCC 11550]|uniref:tRNA-dihydrouridine(16/17) synthase [NAD(P)(+)] n=1 Tax=Hapsidospora chrysogenum (strain ATCC 11550 / CBS 779.69 / DSM 880 / IAM 14645 / JCM 23072 / IMI 49137) TaxID=857340 RepID=A0A086THQ2_HAPC1|nr:tRNA-dihydrouridine(16/17) synthase [NAD(P)(+)]-like protein [Hapsidospora chrysogenum ATCC 11550]